ncbi:type II toxin-antitoxin system RelE/ParE family toxin [Actinomadura monticuli]|uniref:Type II toxin-antitoxin system RelE/ParE family toxin n=1 Tax=Actinomadura monticuli TaxID=3097367 RepID=A0ABV4QBD1_9ACTN
MFEIEMEPEVVTWLDTLPFAQYLRVMRNVDDYLVARGDILDGHHTRALRDGVRELRLYLEETAWRITYWLPTGRGRQIVLLTVFQKDRNGSQPRDVERAVLMRKTCESFHREPAEHYYGRSE